MRSERRRFGMRTAAECESMRGRGLALVSSATVMQICSSMPLPLGGGLSLSPVRTIKNLEPEPSTLYHKP